MTAILLVGAAGQLGKAIQNYASAHEIKLFNAQTYTPRTTDALELIPCSREVLDITQPALIDAFFQRIRPKFLINAAAYTPVDLAETEKQAALEKNAYAAEHLARACKDYDCIMIHVSTDYVFDGNLNRPYLEADCTKPLSVYGQTKLLGEQLIQQTWEKHIILRASWVFGEHGKNFVKTILRLSSEQETLKVVNDQRGCPTNAAHISAVIFQMINQLKKIPKNFGIYHYCDMPAVTWYEFAGEIVACAKKIKHFQVKEILPITTAEFPTPAKRPVNSELNCQKIEQTFHIKRFDWRADLNYLLRAILVTETL